MNKKNTAFTLIEIIIVIIIFCVGILTVLMGLSQTLRNKDYANTQIKSAFFAREGMELVFNLRDANYHKKLPWNCIFKPIPVSSLSSPYDEEYNPFCDDYFKKGTILKISIGSGNEHTYVEKGNPINDFDTAFEEYQIYYHTGTTNGFIYDYNKSNGEPTGFARYIVVDTVTGINNDDKLLKIESHVLYQRGVLTGEKVMETFIGNYEFKQ